LDARIARILETTSAFGLGIVSNLGAVEVSNDHFITF
jgi:hypothetical protein